MVPCHLKYFSALGTSIFDTDKRIKQRQVKLQIDGSVREGQSGGAKTYDVLQRASEPQHWQDADIVSLQVGTLLHLDTSCPPRQVSSCALFSGFRFPRPPQSTEAIYYKKKRRALT